MSVSEVKARLLVVDDEPDFIEFAKWQLELLGFQVATAPSGAEALALVESEPFDLLITDIRMPGMDGIALVREVLKIDETLQCIVITGHGGIETAIEAMRIGAINYLQKPVGIDRLEIAIEKGLEKRELVLAVERKQAKLEKANQELTKLRRQLEIALSKEKTARTRAEAELKQMQSREVMVEVMTLCMRYWKQTTGKSKVDLAEESRIWTATVDSGGTYRTRTLDRYLRLATLPPNPRTNDIIDTGYFVLSQCPLAPEMREELTKTLRLLEALLQKEG